MAYQNWLCFDNAGHAQTISDFSTAHRTRNTLAARLRCPFSLRKKMFFSIVFIFVVFAKKAQTRETQNKQEEQIRFVDLKKHVFQLRTKSRLSHCRDTQKTENKHFLFFIFSLLFYFLSFLVISFHFLHVPSLEKATLPVRRPTCMSTHLVLRM